LLYVITVHWRTPQWIDVQRRYLDRFLSVPFQVWTSLQGIDPAFGARFDRVFTQRGSHAEKLNHLAAEVCDHAAADDIMLFLDGDAFPIADPMPLFTEALSETSLVAVRRSENLGDQQPHPCFCAVTVGEWLRLRGDWGAAATWSATESGRTLSDVGGNLLRRLEVSGAKWRPLLRTNAVNLHPVFFAIYGEVAYHHGAGFRPGEGARVDRAIARENLLDLPSRRLSGLINKRLATRRHAARLNELTNVSRSLFARMEAGDTTWIDELSGAAAGAGI
jgi:hypothetical protein